MLRQALILAGGRGTRLGSLTDATPKPMLPVDGVPFLEYLVNNLRRFGVKNLVMSVGYLGEIVENHFGDGKAFGVDVAYSRESRPLGTGGGLRRALPLLDESFLVLNGDTLFDCNYLDLALLLDSGATAALALRHVDDASRYGSVVCDGERVLEFGEKSRIGPGRVNAGVYALTRRAAMTLQSEVGSIEQDLFPALAARGELAAKAYPGFFLDIGLPETLALAGPALRAWERKPCVFFDRDCLLGGDFVGAPSAEDIPWTKGAVEAVKWCNDCGYLVILIADQAGTVRGERDAADRLREALRLRGAHLDATYYRQPDDDLSGIFDQAMADWRIEATRSAAVGDKPSDLAAWSSRGVAGKVFAGENLLSFVRDFIVPLQGA